MNEAKPGPVAASRLERWVAALTSLACIIISLAAWRSVAPYQGMWPLPGLYFLEMPLVTLVVAAAFASGAASRRILAWIGLGIITAFAILGALSIGMAYVPVALLLAILAVSSDLREGQPLTIHVGVCLVAAMAQTSLMLLAIRALYP